MRRNQGECFEKKQCLQSEGTVTKLVSESNVHKKLCNKLSKVAKNFMPYYKVGIIG